MKPKQELIETIKRLLSAEDMERGTLVLYQLIIFVTSGNSSSFAKRFTAEVDMLRKRVASAPQYLPFFTISIA